jgi:transcription antitermination factor NusG
MLSRNRKWPWFAIQVRIGRERTARLLLENVGYETFLPTCGHKHRWQEGVKERELPLLSGFLFCRMNPHDRLPVLRTEGVIQIVGTEKTAVPVEDEELAAIQQIIKSGLPAMPWPYLPLGNVAYLAKGPLQGLSGVLIKGKFGMKLIVSVTLLQRSVAVEIDRDWISAVQPLKPATNQASSSSLPVTARSFVPLDFAHARH